MSSDATEEQKEVIEEKTTFDVLITSFNPDNKIKLIKEVKNILSLGLKEAKEVLENVKNQPLVLYKNVGKDQNVEQLESLGAVLEWR